MSKRKPLTDTEKKLAAPKRGGHRALRSARRKAYYSARPAFTLANKKRTLGAHIRAFPEDQPAVAQYAKRYGGVEGLLASAGSKARKRAKRRARSAKRIADIKHELSQPAVSHFDPPGSYYVALDLCHVA